MKNMIIKLVFVCLMMGPIVFHSQGVWAEEEMVNRTINLTGKLVAVDSEKSTITVEQVTGDEEEGSSSVVLSIEPSTIIEMAEEPITLNDLVVEQTVTVEGMVNESGDLTAWSIRVE